MLVFNTGGYIDYHTHAVSSSCWYGYLFSRYTQHCCAMHLDDVLQHAAATCICRSASNCRCSWSSSGSIFALLVRLQLAALLVVLGANVLYVWCASSKLLCKRAAKECIDCGVAALLFVLNRMVSSS